MHIVAAWIETNIMTARIAPAAPPLPDDIQHALDRIMPPGYAPLTLFTTLARDARLFRKFFSAGLLDRGHLTIRQREIVIDRTTALCRSEYEWGVHIALFAARAELTPAQVASLTSGTPMEPYAARFQNGARSIVQEADTSTGEPSHH